MGDDGIAIYVINSLKKKLMSLNIQVIIGETDLDYCLDMINTNDFIIIVDSAPVKNYIGNIKAIGINDLFYNKNTLNSHNLNLIDFLKITNTKINGFVISIEIDSTNIGHSLNSNLIKDFNKISNEVYNVILNLI